MDPYDIPSVLLDSASQCVVGEDGVLMVTPIPGILVCVLVSPWYPGADAEPLTTTEREAYR